MLHPRPRWGAYSTPQPLAGFKGPTSKGGEGKGGVESVGKRKGVDKGDGKGRGGKGRRKEWEGQGKGKGEGDKEEGRGNGRAEGVFWQIKIYDHTPGSGDVLTLLATRNLYSETTSTNMLPICYIFVPLTFKTGKARALVGYMPPAPMLPFFR